MTKMMQKSTESNNSVERAAPEPATLATNPIRILQLAIERGVQAEQLERLSALVERWYATEASAAFGRALTGFQRDCPIILKTQQADRYKFAGYEDIKAITRPIEAKHGLSVSFSQPRVDGGLYEIVVYLRVGPHQEARPFAVAIANLEPVLQDIATRQKINIAQAYGFWLSYQKRYAYCAALDVVVAKEDSDAGKGLRNAAQDDEKRDALLEAVREAYGKTEMTEEQEDAMWKYAACGTCNFDDVPGDRLQMVLKRLRRTIEVKAGKAVAS